MTGIIPSPAQESRRNLFREAVAYARATNNDPYARKKYAAPLPAGQ